MSGDHNMYASGSGDGQRSAWRKRTIMELARESGVVPYVFVSVDEECLFRLKAFAALVREEATAEANARANASWTLMCEKMVAIEREAVKDLLTEWNMTWLIQHLQKIFEQRDKHDKLLRVLQTPRFYDIDQV